MRRLLPLLSLAVALASVAQAQTASDVIVMRRTVAPANIANAPSHNGGTWKTGDPVVTPGCSATSPSLAPVTCVDGSGSEIAQSRCAAATKPTGVGTAPSYSTCSYKWITGTYSDPTPACSVNAYRSRSVTCQRQDAALTPVAASFCDPNSPDAKTSEGPVESIVGCTYTPTFYFLYGECVADAPGSSSGTQTAQLTKCTRSDQVDVTARNEAKHEFCAATTSRSCVADVPTAQYAITNACTPTTAGGASGTTTNAISACVSQSGTGVALSKCSHLAQSKTTSCTITYKGDYTYGTCTNGSQSGTLSRCNATDSNGIVITAANSSCPATSTQTCVVAAKCATLQQFRLPTGATGTTKIAGYSTSRTAADMQSVCENYAGSKTGSCWMNNSGTTEVYWETATTLVTRPASDTHLYAALCSPK